jgi:hypothetical protein
VKNVALILTLMTAQFALATTERDARLLFCSKLLAQWDQFETVEWTDDLLEQKETQALALIRRLAGPESEAQAKAAFDAEGNDLTLDAIMEFMSGPKVQQVREGLEKVRKNLLAKQEDLDASDAANFDLYPYQFDPEVDALTEWNVRRQKAVLAAFEARHFSSDMVWFPDFKIRANRAALVDLAKIYGRFVTGRPFVANDSLASEIQLYAEFAVVQAITKMDGFRTLFHMVSSREWELNNETVLYSGKENTDTLRTLLRMVFIYELFHPGSIASMEKYYKTPFVPWLVDKLTETQDERPYGLRYSIAMVLALIEQHHRLRTLSTLLEGMANRDTSSMENARQGYRSSPVQRSTTMLEQVLQIWAEERRARRVVDETIPPYEKAILWSIRPHLQEEDADEDWQVLQFAIDNYLHVGKQLRALKEEDTEEP